MNRHNTTYTDRLKNRLLISLHMTFILLTTRPILAPEGGV